VTNIEYVATLALGSWPKQGLQGCKPKVNPGVTSHAPKECKRVWGNEPSHSQVNFHLDSWSPKWTPEFSESNCMGQNSMDQCVPYIIEKFLNVDVWNGLVWPIWTFETQVMMKREVGSQIGNLTPEHEKSGIDPISLHVGGERHTIGNLSTTTTTWFQTSSQSKVFTQSYGPPKLQESQLCEFRDSYLGVSGQKIIWMWTSWRDTKYTNRGKVVASPKFGRWWVLWIWICPWFILAPKVFKLCINQLVVWFVQIHVSD
jgi:hypothetical protein